MPVSIFVSLNIKFKVLSTICRGLPGVELRERREDEDFLDLLNLEDFLEDRLLDCFELDREGDAFLRE